VATTSASILRAWAAAALLAAAPSAQDPAARSAPPPDPYTRGEPAAMAAAGYVSFGPFPFGYRHGSGDVVALLGNEPLVWIETAHFRIGCALSPLRLRGDREWLDHVKAELKQLKTRLPTVKTNPRELDPWLRAHLIAQRCEALYAEVCEHLGVTDATFPSGPDQLGRFDASTYEGAGPYLGLEHKFAVLLLQRTASLARYTRAYQGVETMEPKRHYDPGSAMTFAVAEETTNGLLKDDFALHTHLVYNLASNLYNGYRGYHHELPPWLLGGLAHWHARRVCPRFPAYERQAGDTDHETRDFWKWDERAQGLMRNKAFEPLTALLARTDLTQFGMEQHIQAWAFVDFLMATRKAATMKFLRGMKDPFHALRSEPTQAEVSERAAALFPQAFALDPAGLEDVWRAHLLSGRRK